MATTFKWATAESAVSAMTTTLNALGNATYAGLSSTIPNSTDLYEYIALELNLAALSPTAGAYVEVWILYAIDAANFATTGKPLTTSALLCVFQLDTTASTAQRLYKAGMAIAPHDFKLDLRNKAGAAFGASGNTLKYSRYNDQGV
jgi:hypothetical protein